MTGAEGWIPACDLFMVMVVLHLLSMLFLKSRWSPLLSAEQTLLGDILC